MRLLALCLAATLAGCTASTASRRPLAELEQETEEEVRLEEPHGPMMASISNWVPRQTALTLLGGLAAVAPKNFPGDVIYSGDIDLAQGQKLSWNGTTETKYTSSDGTTLTLTGLNERVPGLGVGTTPSYLLHLAGTATGGVMLGITGSAMTTSDIGFFLGGPTLTGSIELMRMSAATTQQADANITNSNNSSGSAHARFRVISTGASGGDPYYGMTISGVDDWCSGVDNSDSDKWGVWRSSTPGSNPLITATTTGDLNVTGRLSNTVQSVSVASNGTGTAATDTLTPSSTYVSYTCNDTDGCTITLSETGAVNGSVVYIVNVSSNTCTFADTSGVTELTGSVALGQYDTLTLLYAADRWVELTASNN